MKSKWRIKTLAVALLAITALSACNNAGKNNAGQAPSGGTQGGTPPAGTTQGGTTATAGVEALAKQNCIACHGDTLDGIGDQKKNLQNVGARLTKDQIANVIANGRNNMPAFKGRLKDEDIASLSDWLAAKK